jgi:hypothetical protein
MRAATLVGRHFTGGADRLFFGHGGTLFGVSLAHETHNQTN